MIFSLALALALMQSPAADAVKAADAAMTAADFSKALKLLEALDPRTATQADLEAAALLRAECLMALQRPREVEAALADAVTVNPSVSLGVNASPRLVAALERVKAAMVGTLELSSNLEGALALIDGRRFGPLPLTVPLVMGKHRIKIESEGAAASREVEVFAGKATVLDLQVTTSQAAEVVVVPRAQPSKVVPVLLMGLGAGVAAAGGVLLGTSLSWNAPGQLDQVEIDQARQLHQSAQLRHDLGIATLAVGGAAAVTGLVILLLTPSKVSTTALIAPIPGGAVVGFVGSY